MTLANLNDRSRCPDCDSEMFQVGPRGGFAQNIRCVLCGSEFWFCPPFQPERLQGDPRERAKFYVNSPVVELRVWRDARPYNGD